MNRTQKLDDLIVTISVDGLGHVVSLLPKVEEETGGVVPRPLFASRFVRC